MTERTKRGFLIVPEEEATVKEYRFVYRDFDGREIAIEERRDYYKDGERVAIRRDGKRRIVDKTFRRFHKIDGTWIPSSEIDPAVKPIWTERPPYNADRIPQARTVWIVEGEKSADRLSELFDAADKANPGARVATTLGGSSDANLWANWTWALEDKKVVVCADADPPGELALWETIRALARPCGILRFRERPDGAPAPNSYDVENYIDDAIREGLDPLASLEARIVDSTSETNQ